MLKRINELLMVKEGLFNYFSNGFDFGENLYASNLNKAWIFNNTSPIFFRKLNNFIVIKLLLVVTFF